MTAAPSAARRRRLTAPALVIAATAAGAAAVGLRDPHVGGSWGVCPFLLLTGRPCPFCGGLRATNDLLHGDLAAAAGSNALVLLAVPVLAGWLLLWSRRLLRDGDQAGVPAPGRRTAVVAVVLVAAFGLLRWLPRFADLAP